MHKHRFLSSLIMSGLVVIVLTLPDMFFTLCISVFVVLGLNEFFDMLRQKDILDNNKFIGICLGALIPVFYYWLAFWDGHYLAAAVVLVVFVIFIYQFFRRNGQQAMINLALVLLGVLYISFNLSFMVKIKMLPAGGLFVAYLLLVAKFGDIGAYLIGSIWGRHRLIPRISPNKSIEGAVGGLVFSVVISLLSFPILVKGSGIIESLFLGLILGSLAQVGDLAESLVKRDCQVKDSGVFIPGLGGFLDIIDSVIFVTPAFYFYLVTFR